MTVRSFTKPKDNTEIKDWGGKKTILDWKEGGMAWGDTFSPVTIE
mgnify:CR=1 FL=1